MNNVLKRVKRTHLLIGLLAAVIVVALIFIWRAWVSPTRIAFVNYGAIEQGQIARANDFTMVRLAQVGPDDFDQLTSYDMIFVNGMGLRVDSTQRALLKKAAEQVPTLTHAATNPDNNIVSISGFDADYLMRYIENGSRRNYRALLAFVRKFVDGKRLWAPEPDVVEERPDNLLTHCDPTDPDADEHGFGSVGEYNDFLTKHDLLKTGAPAVIIAGFMGPADDLTREFERQGCVVYRVNKINTFISGHHADSLKIAAVINMAHGRLGDSFVEFLKQKNVPLFTPVNVNCLTEDWMADAKGMTGGFLSQSIVTPEIDGAIRPYAVFAHRVNSEGLQEAYGIPDRMTAFVESVKGYARLQNMKNADKRVAIFYFKGPGQNSLVASGLEVVPSLYNTLVRLRSEGYDVSGLPASADELARQIQAQGAVFGAYAEGAYSNFIRTAKPELVSAEQFTDWVSRALPEQLIDEMTELNGPFPGKYLVADDGRLAVARLQFGNIALIPQVMAGEGSDQFKIVHGTDQAPPYTYIASYLWARYGFQADALIHFGTHGSLEYTPRKQVALSSLDWADRLIGVAPHFYIYTIGNVGEAMIAKRRTYAQTQSYLTPPFKESDLRNTYKQLNEAIATYNRQPSDAQAAKVKDLTTQLGIARDLGLDSLKPYTAADIARVESFADELVNEKITGRLYTMGQPYEADDIRTSVFAMATDPIAYGLLAIDKQKGRAKTDVEKRKQLFSQLYGERARAEVGRLLGGAQVSDDYICKFAGVSADELAMARKVAAMQAAPDAISMMMQMAGSISTGAKKDTAAADHRTVSELRAAGEMGKREVPQMSREAFEKMEQSGRFPQKMMDAIREGQRWYQMEQKQQDAQAKAAERKSKRSGAPTYTREQIHLAQAITAIEQALQNVSNYATALATSPEQEMKSLLGALSGGYTAPTSGGDPIVNPNALPTGRNLFSINVENTPTEDAWEKGQELADNTIRMYRERHGGEYPRKVSFTLWSSEFIETQGATIAQILYMLGVEPARDAFGRVTDIRLIPSDVLGRPRIDVVVQTSGQLRDLAASRLFLINRAIEMAANAQGDKFDNLVREGVVESEKVLVEKGMSPKEAREVSLFRIFGGVNGGYGTGIQAMVEAGDKWDAETQIAEVYMNNMGAFYGDEKNWETVRTAAFEAALTRTDVVVQPRQSNTWGALSLDHVYEFMGGLNLAVRNVTGKDPDAYLADYRNHNNMRMQEVKEAIGVESRTTLFNPAYIKERMKGGANSAGAITDMVKNTYGWNVMKPEAIDNEMWDQIYDTYVKDKNNLGTRDFFEKQNPAALQEITAVMLESARKGLWQASEQQVKDVAQLHVETVNKFKPSCSGFVCDNGKLRDFIGQLTDAAQAKEYQQNVSQIRDAQASADNKGMVMKKETLADSSERTRTVVSGIVVGAIVIAAFVGIALVVRRRRKNMEE